MVLRQRVRVHVSSPGGSRKPVLESVRGTLRNRVLTKLLGNQYGVLILTPVGKNVESVEIIESRSPEPS